MGTRIALPHFIAQLVEVGARELRQGCGLRADDAEALMARIAGRFCDLNSRRLVYVPSADIVRRSVRNAQIYAEWSAPEDADTVGRAYSAPRIAAIAEKHNLTTAQIYTVLKEQRALRREGNTAGDELLRSLAEGFDQAEPAEPAAAD